MDNDNAKSQAEQIAAALMDSGQVWHTEDGRSMTDLLEAAGARRRPYTDTLPIRHELPDGSAIIEGDGGWDVGFPSTDDDDRYGCTCWAGVCDADQCTDGCACGCHASEPDAVLASGYPDGVEDFDEPGEHRVERDGDRDLQFAGWMLGEGEHGTGGEVPSDWTRGITVRVFLTTGGRLITASRRWSRWEGASETSSAAAHDSPEAALAWLRGDASKGKLGPASKDAWEAACAAWPQLAGQDVERID